MDINLENLKQQTIQRVIKDDDSPAEKERKLKLIDQLVYHTQMAQLDNLITSMENF